MPYLCGFWRFANAYNLISQWGDYSGNINFSQLFAGLLGNKYMEADDARELDKLLAKNKNNLKCWRL